MISYFDLTIMLFHNPMATTPEEIQKALEILEGKKSNVLGCKTCCNTPHLALYVNWIPVETRKFYDTFVLSDDYKQNVTVTQSALCTQTFC